MSENSATQSLDDIADSIIGIPGGQEQSSESGDIPSEGTSNGREVEASEEAKAEPDADDDGLESSSSEDDTAEAGDEVAEPTEETDDAEELSASSEPEPYLDVTDDDLIEVKIDGKVVYKTVGEAKQALSGAGAVESRIKEAAEERKTAQAERAKGLELLEQQRGQLVQAVTQLEQHLFPPMVAVPDEALRATDPQRYLLQDNDYRADQQRIAQSKAQLVQNLQEQQRQQQENFTIYRNEQEKILVEKIPELAGENGKDRLMQIAETAAAYGFSQQEISMAADHRIFVMADDARKYRELLAKAKLKKGDVKKDDVTTRVPRRLRSGVAKRKALATQKSRERKAATAKAQKTGKTDDVLATILTRAQ